LIAKCADLPRPKLRVSDSHGHEYRDDEKNGVSRLQPQSVSTFRNRRCAENTGAPERRRIRELFSREKVRASLTKFYLSAN
jgi:hypothetical protein